MSKKRKSNHFKALQAKMAATNFHPLHSQPRDKDPNGDSALNEVKSRKREQEANDIVQQRAVHSHHRRRSTRRFNFLNIVPEAESNKMQSNSVATTSISTSAPNQLETKSSEFHLTANDTATSAASPPMLPNSTLQARTRANAPKEITTKLEPWSLWGLKQVRSINPIQLSAILQSRAQHSYEQYIQFVASTQLGVRNVIKAGYSTFAEAANGCPNSPNRKNVEPLGPDQAHNWQTQVHAYATHHVTQYEIICSICDCRQKRFNRRPGEFFLNLKSKTIMGFA